MDLSQDRPILDSPSSRVPRIVLQRVEEAFPAVTETMVSVLCLHRKEYFCLHDLQVQRNQIFYDKVVLIFIIHVATFCMDGCGCYSSLAYWV
jgi:hypothetical protein